MLNKCTFKEKQREKNENFHIALDKTYIIRIYIQRMFVYNKRIEATQLRQLEYADENSLMDLYLHKINIYIRLVSGVRRRRRQRRHELPGRIFCFLCKMEIKRTYSKKKCLSFCINNNGGPGTFLGTICHLSISSFYYRNVKAPDITPKPSDIHTITHSLPN